MSLTNISFDVSIAEIFTPLFFGATLYLYKDISKSTTNELIEYIKDKEITFSYFPPAILEDVVDLLVKDKEKIKLNKILVGVEPIKRTTLQKFNEINNQIKIINGYGPSETTICSTMYDFNEGKDDEEIVPIGKPINNTQIYILNSDKNIVPINTIGEIYISGNGVGKGYKENQQLTNEKYIIYNDKITFKTGDLGKWNKNGDIIFVGRNDNQVKFRGYRIDLGEIENSLKALNSIKNAVVILDKENYKEEKLIAFYIPENKNILEESLRELLSKTLPYYMLPSKLIELKSFPITPNGKIDKKKLISIVKDESKQDIVLPYTDIQQSICNVLKEKLKRNELSINENFFDIGIDSLQAISLIIELEKKNIFINLQDFYNFPTIQLLANKIENEKQKLKENDKMYKEKIIYEKKIMSTIDGNILLLGATGFLGSHILRELIGRTNARIYCLIRATTKNKAIDRLKERLSFYFGDEFYDNYSERIIVINGDFTDNDFGMNKRDYNTIKKDVSIILNSAGCVKHFGNVEYFYNVNYLSVKKSLEFCKEEKKQFIQISTMSILDETNNNKEMNEKTLYNMQKLDNIYIKTKFEAEQLIAEYIENGLNATIFRLGNIMWRLDGKFQINDAENAFVTKIKTIAKYQICPNEILDYEVDLSPVDICSSIIVEILKNNKFNVYHIENNNKITIKNIIDYLEQLGIEIEIADKKTFKQKIIKKSSSNQELMSLLENERKKVVINSKHTLDFIKELNLKWNIVDINYMRNILEIIKGV